MLVIGNRFLTNVTNLITIIYEAFDDKNMNIFYDDANGPDWEVWVGGIKT